MIDNTRFFLALNYISGIGPRITARLYQKWPDLSVLFALSVQELIQAGIPEKLAEKIALFDFSNLESDWRWLEGDNRYIVSVEGTYYPKLLRQIEDPPPILYMEGQPSCLNLPSLAIVGTRHPSLGGSKTAYSFAQDASKAGIAIVSGLAIGIDGEAHRGAIAGGGTTIAVLATGIDRIYPQRHHSLAKKIIENGLIISEFPLQTPPRTGQFPRRNRIISGLSLSTLVVEAATRSGSLITARFALEQNREVMAVPASIYNEKASGCHHLLQQGAKLVTKSAEVIDEVCTNTANSCLEEPKLSETIRDIQGTVAKPYEKLVQCMSFDSVMTVDTIAACCQQPVHEVINGLMELEMQNLVKATMGGYMRCIE